MERISWETIKLNTKRYRQGVAMVSIGIGTGRMSISSAACDMIPNVYNYQYIEPLKSRGADDTIDVLGLKFTNTPTSSTLSVKRNKYKGEPTGGCQFSSKQLARTLFGNIKKPITEQFAVKKYDDDTLAVILTKPLD